METNSPSGEAAVERPVLFRVARRSSSRQLGLAPDLPGAMLIAAGHRRAPAGPGEFLLTAVYADGSEEEIPPGRYCRPPGATREEALRHIKSRDEGVRMAREIGLYDEQIAVLLADKLGRCSPGDPREKQIEDYVRSAPEGWLSAEELRAEQEKIFREKKPAAPRASHAPIA